jgi:hypothetical protein
MMAAVAHFITWYRQQAVSWRCMCVLTAGVIVGVGSGGRGNADNGVVKSKSVHCVGAERLGTYLPR